MDKLTANKSHIPGQTWAGQNGWSTAATQGALFNSLSGSQHLSLGLSSDQRPSCDQLQLSNQSCMSNVSSLSSTHHSALYKASHSSSSSSTSLFASSATPSSSHGISFAQQNPHTSSMLLTANQGNGSYKVSFQPPSTNQGLPNGLQELPISLSLCGQPRSTSQATFEGANVGFSGGSGYTHSHASSTCQEQQQWMPSSHCRGAPNESVPDSASQQGNMNSLASNDTRRSVLVQQRAQLLQQLAELNKLLESIPPDDSSGGQPPHTAIQFPTSMDGSLQCEHNTGDAQRDQLSARKSKSHSCLSANFLSSASYDEPSETCDTPDDPMPAAEPLREDNASVRSDNDSDPDYFPNGGDDMSDFLSDSDCSVASRHSRPFAATEERNPPRPKKRAKSASSSFTAAEERKPPRPKKRAKSGSSSLKATEERDPTPPKKRAKCGGSTLKVKSVSHPKQTQAVNLRRSSETLVMGSSNSKVQRVYDRRNYCVFCSKPVSKMARHLETVHSEKKEVAAAFQFPKKSRERQKIWNRLINLGNFAHNKTVLKTGKGQLAARKRPRTAANAQNFLHCLFCRGLFVKKALFRHMRQCPERGKNADEITMGRRRVALQCALQMVDDLGVTDGLKNVLTQMTHNDVTEVVLGDKLILQYGELLLNQYGPDPQKHGYIRQNLRQIARLVLEAQKITPLKKLEDFFYPSNFPHVVAAVNVLAGYDPDNKTYSIPSLAIKLGYNLQTACTIVEGNAEESGDASLAESARNFLSVYHKQWNGLISSDALSTLRETKLDKEKKVPFAQDVKCLSFHMENVHHLAEKKLRESPSAENYTALCRVMVSRVIIFNRRSTTEISSLQLKDFMSRKKSDLHAGMDLSISDLERTMCEFFTRVDIRGKCGRMVPVLLKPSFESALELLVEVRKACGIPNENPYLFARPSALTFYNGSECLQKFVKECGAKDPNMLKSFKIRKHYASMLQMINLDEEEADRILGPNNQVRKLRQGSIMQLDDFEMDSDGRSQRARGQKAASWAHSERHGPNKMEHKTSARSGKNGSSGAQNQGKHKWEEAEVRAVEKHLMHLIQEHKVPQKNDCIQCIQAEPEALRTRTWKGIKDYVRNRITALKRQGGTAKATYT